jgi:Odorant response abnormal 4-like
MLSTQIRIIRASVPVTAATMGFVPAGEDVKAVAALLNAQSLTLDAASDALVRAVLQISPDVYVVDEDDSRALSSVVQHEGSSRDSEDGLNVRVLVPLGDNIAEPTDSPQKTDNGRVVRLGGALCVCAVVLADALLGEVLSAVRTDMSLTLWSRAEILRELDEEEEGAGKGVTDYSARQLPARVLANRVASTGLPFCDYLVLDETVEHDAIPRMSEMLSWSKQDQAAHNISLIEKGFKKPASWSVPSESPPAHASLAGNSERQDVLSARVSTNAQAPTNLNLACGIVMAFVVAALGVAYQLAYPARTS